MVPFFDIRPDLLKPRGVLARIRISAEEMRAAQFSGRISLMDILSGGSNEVEPAYDRTTAGQGAMLANKIAGPPSIKERLEHEIAVTEKRLAAMKAGLEVIENAPALETLQQALAAMNRHNY